MRRFLDWMIIEDGWTAILMALTGVMIVALLMSFVDEITSEQISLRKDDWTCTQERQEIVSVKPPAVDDVCVRWERKA